MHQVLYDIRGCALQNQPNNMTKPQSLSSSQWLLIANLKWEKKKKMFLGAVLQVAPSKKCILVPT